MLSSTPLLPSVLHFRREGVIQVASEPQYRLTVVINCPSMQRLDHRLVDRAGLARRFHTVLEAKALSDIREAANEGMLLIKTK